MSKIGIGRSLIYLAGVIALSVGMLYLFAEKEQGSSRFYLTIFSVVLAELSVWAYIKDPVLVSGKTFAQSFPTYAGMGVIVGIYVLGAIISLIIFFTDYSYKVLLGIDAILLLFLIIGSVSISTVTRVAIGQAESLINQSRFMVEFRSNIGDMIANGRNQGVDPKSAYFREIIRLQEELRFVTVPSLDGCENVNEELSTLFAELNKSVLSVGVLVESSMQEQIVYQVQRVLTTLKRREQLILRLRG